MKPPGKIVVAVLAIAIGLGSFFVFWHESPVPVAGEKSSSAEASSADSLRDTLDSQLPSESTGHSSDCIPMTGVRRSPVAYRADEWYRSWGAPANFSSEFFARPYASYSTESLDRLVGNGDAEAAQELGQSLVWQAFREGERLPDYETLYELGSDDYPYGDRIDLDVLERGRTYLYEAALGGRLYALIDISLSYAHHATVERERGEMTAEQIDAMLIEAFAYGEAVEKLIPRMPEHIFSVRIPEAAESSANERLDALVQRFKLDRAKRGLDASTLPTISDEVLDALNLCFRLLD